MPTTEELLDTAIAHHQTGRLQQAAQLYRTILQDVPGHPDALHLLGLVGYQLGDHHQAITSIRQALVLRPNASEFWDNLAAVLHATARYQEAIDASREAIRCRPNNSRSYFNLGSAYQALGDWNQAIENYEQAIRLDVNSVDAHNNLGNTFKELARWDDAIASYRRALQLNPRFLQANNNLGAVYLERGDLEEAAACFRFTLEIDPKLVEARRNLGLALSRQGKHDEAIRTLRQVIEHDPDDAEAHLNLGLSLLRREQYEEGWHHYEWRWQARKDGFKGFPFSQPMWDGRPLNGQSLLLHAEQGFGDTIQFIRYAPLVQERGGKVLVQGQAALIPLLKSCPGIDFLAPKGTELPPFDFHAPLASLPRIMGTNGTNIPAPVPYIFAREDLIDRWKDKLKPIRGFRIGICWQGSVNYAGDRQRSIALKEFAPLAEIPGVQLICLQKGQGTEQLATVDFPVRVLGSEFDETNGAFMDTAAVMKNLDLVITCDSSVGHLAGALDIPVWLALSYVPDWRWTLHGDCSPWYRSARLFRQSQGGNWQPVFDQIRDAVLELLPTRTPLVPTDRAIRIAISPAELVDRIVQLELKRERVTDPEQLSAVDAELIELAAIRNRELTGSPALAELTAELKAVNEKLLQCEHDLTECERNNDFGTTFVDRARSLLQLRSHRDDVKQRLNALFATGQ